jgi:hypothetical protein
LSEPAILPPLLHVMARGAALLWRFSDLFSHPSMIEHG